MKKHLIFSLGMLGLMLRVQAGELVLRYDTPANDTMTEALPVGNGMLGGMIHGKPEFERVVLNEISLWTGDEKTATGGYDEMGSYQTLGILNIDTLAKSGAGEAKVPIVVCASGQESFYQRENIEASTDNNPGTKWCVVPDGVPLIWELRLPEARAVSQYAFTSAGDVQERDPSTWTFSGSNNGKEWTLLDSHENEPPMDKRCAVKTYTCTNDKAFKSYRLTFAPKKGVMHFQIAEISIPGVIFPGKVAPEKVENYSRTLNLATATHRVTYKAGDVTYCRETLASKPDQVMVIRLTADKPGSCGGAVLLKGGHREVTQASKNGLHFLGVLTNNLKYVTSARVLNEGGSVQAGEGLIYFSACDSVTILLAASTDYTSDHSTAYRGGDPKAVVEKRLVAAARKKYDALKAAHIKEYQSYFNRVALDVGTTPAERLSLPTNKRKSLHAEKGGDADLEELMFQYGRYLLISCSRPGGLPANLQGMWNDNNYPPWHSDYHANINVQMNYWLAEPANLSECHTALLDLIVSQLPAWRKATAEAKEFKSTSGKPVGWAVRTSHGINGDMGWQWDITANAWYCQHFWWHYSYTGDKTWLKNVAYPIMKEICEFWDVRMKALPDGTLVVPNGWSPEQGPVEDGVSYNQEICWDLFNNYVAASEALGVDEDYRKKIAGMRDKLMVPKIGKWGQLQEWMVDRDDPNNHHRHTSHLFGLFPGEQFSVSKTPELAIGAKKSLDARGPVGDVREWSFAWRTALYARLREGESAYTMFRNLLNDRNTCLNLFGNHPPMQMDGNFGITAGVCEMLMQSYTGTIELLPAIPKAWPTGSVKGLKARGNFTVDIAWDQGKVISYSIRSPTSREVKVRVNGEEKIIATNISVNLEAYPSLENLVKSPGKTTYYVDPVSGSDDNTGTRASKPWRTLKRVNQLLLAAGDRIELKPGAYRETLKPSGAGTVKNPIIICFAVGEYDFYPEQSLKLKLHISNTNDDPNTPKAIALAFQRVRHVQVIGGAAGKRSDLYMRGKMIQTFFDQAEDVCLSGLTFDYRRPTTSEYTVEDVAGGHADLAIHKDSKYVIEQGKMVWVGEGWRHDAFRQSAQQQGNVEEGTLWRSGINFDKVSKLEELAPHKIRVSYSENPGFIKGRVWQERATYRDYAGSFARNSKDISWANCAYHYMHGMGLVNQYCENLTLKKVDLSPRPGSGRTCACWADAIQVSGCKGKFIAEDCTFSGTNDDPINVHGTHLRIVERPASDQVQVRFCHGQTYGFEAFFAGDDIDFVHPYSLQIFASGKVKKAEMKGERDMLLTLEKPAPDGIRANDVIENVTWTPEVYVRNCQVTMCSTRGFLLTTRRKVIIENNLFHRTAMWAIFVSNDARGWFESGPVRDMTIRSNQFVKCGIALWPENSSAKPAEPVHENIRIEGNVFEHTEIVAKSIKGLVITGNQSIPGDLKVHTEACTDLKKENNFKGVLCETDQKSEKK